MNYIFDLDETLIQNSGILREVVLKLSRNFMSKNYEPQLGRGRYQRLKQKYAHYHYVKTRQYLDEGLIQLSPGVEKFLNEKPGYMAGLTNAPYRSTEAKLEKLGLQDLLEITLTPRDVTRKPSPEGVNSIIEESGLRPEDFVFVGNAVTDIMAGRRAGIKTVSISRDPLNIFLADEAYSSFQEFAENH